MSKKPQANERRVILCHSRPQVITQRREKNSHQLTLGRPTYFVYCVRWPGYEVIQSKHLNMFWVSGQGRDDNMTGPGDVWRANLLVWHKSQQKSFIVPKIHEVTRAVRICVRFGHVVEQLDAITPAGSNGRSALVSWSLGEGARSVFTPESRPGQGQQQILREDIEMVPHIHLNGPVRMCLQILCCFTVLPKLWVKGQGHREEFLWFWLMGIGAWVCIVITFVSVLSLTSTFLLSTTISSDSFVSLCQNMEFNVIIISEFSSVLDKSHLMWRRGSSESIKMYVIKTPNVMCIFQGRVLNQKVCVWVTWNWVPLCSFCARVYLSVVFVIRIIGWMKYNLGLTVCFHFYVEFLYLGRL